MKTDRNCLCNCEQRVIAFDQQSLSPAALGRPGSNDLLHPLSEVLRIDLTGCLDQRALKVYMGETDLCPEHRCELPFHCVAYGITDHHAAVTFESAHTACVYFLRIVTPGAAVSTPFITGST